MLLLGAVSTSCWTAIGGASSSDGERARLVSSSESSGDEVLGVPGVESGEEAMLLVEDARAGPSPKPKVKQNTARQQLQRGLGRGCLRFVGEALVYHVRCVVATDQSGRQPRHPVQSSS